ncbi:MAG: hypothetical protein JXL97_17185 [Bacteroidales bacterium]|nr:hypothetical protein [Bacteroidales bacterium]
MQFVFRKITSIVNNEIHFKVPEDFYSDEVEVIVIPISKIENNKSVNFDNYYGISDIGEKEIEKQLNELRKEWDRKVLD